MKKIIVFTVVIFLSGCGIFETEESTIKLGVIKNEILCNGKILFVVNDYPYEWNIEGELINTKNGSYFWRVPLK